MSELRLVSREILLQGAHQPLGVRGTHDQACDELALRHRREKIDEIQRELLGIVVNDDQIGILAEQFLLVGLDLNLLLLLWLVQPSISP